MSVCVGAASAGGRAISATASQGLVLMSEVLWNASGMRLPIVLINGNRALGAPISIHGDHNDIMSVRDAGWIQLFAESPQEVYDFLLCAPRIAENDEVRLPIIIAMDCFQTTHTATNIEIEADREVQKFIGETKTKNSLLDIKNPTVQGSFAKPPFYMEFRAQQAEAMKQAEKTIINVFSEFQKKFRRGNSFLVDNYKTENAEIIVVVLGSTAGTLRRTVDFLREKGVKVGLLRLKCFRPFPMNELQKEMRNAKKVLVLDRMSPGGGSFGALFLEVSAALSKTNNIPQLKNAIYGLGGRETNFEDFAQIIENFDKLPEIPEWINLKKL
jgi:pyruvate ferredoxin oxidoreductase alpha subunit